MWAGVRASVSALNERQRALLERLAAGEEPGAWAPGEWHSVYALRDRGLLTRSKSGGDVHVEVTEAGRFYLRHGRHPDAASDCNRQATTQERKSCKPVIGYS